MEWCGLKLHADRNRAAIGLAPGHAAKISMDESRLEAYVVAADEETWIARETVRCVRDHTFIDQQRRSRLSAGCNGEGEIMGNPLSQKELKMIDAYWRAANYLSVGQIYLYDNPLLKKPLKKEHIKPRLLGHWGTTPGLNFIYAHLNRVIKQRDLNMIYIIGPGHGGPGIVANAYMEGTYSEVYPNIAQDEEGMKRLVHSILISRAAFPATWHPRLPDPFTKEVNWVMRFRTPTGLRTTIPT